MKRMIYRTIHSANEAMTAITANDLKTKGISALESALEEDDEVRVSVRGQDRFVILSVDRFARLREFELLDAIRETREEYEAGNFDVMTAEEHIRRLLEDDEA